MYNYKYLSKYVYISAPAFVDIYSDFNFIQDTACTSVSRPAACLLSTLLGTAIVDRITVTIA